MFDFPKGIDPIRNSSVFCSHGNRNSNRTALRACSSSGLVKVSSLRLVFLLSSDDPGPWDPTYPVAVEPLLCPSTFEDLAESGLLEPEGALVSKEQGAQQFVQYFVIFSRLGGHCVRKRLDAIFDPGRVLYEER